MYLKLALATFVGAAMCTAAYAEGPPIYNHTIERTHSPFVCMQRATAVAVAKGMHTEGNSYAVWMTDTSNYSHIIRCDLPNTTLFITAGPADGLRANNKEIRELYSTIDLTKN